LVRKNVRISAIPLRLRRTGDPKGPDDIATG
jgi:hypothetical protein